MIRREKEVLKNCPKEQLIYLIENLKKSQNLIAEVCVEESKCHIDSSEAINKIRGYIYDMPSLYNVTNLKAYIDMKIGKISITKYRSIIGLD